MTNTIQELTVNEAWRDEQDAWNNRSNYFVEMHNREDRKAQVTEFLSFLKDENLLPQNGGRTLDVGCGVCDYALGLAREGYKATGIDLSDGMIRGAKQLAEAEGLNLSLYIAPWSDETRRELTWDKTFDKAVNYFTMRLHNNTGGDMEDMKAEIRNLIEPLAINGEIHNKTVDKVAWVSWSVK